MDFDKLITENEQKVASMVEEHKNEKRMCERDMLHSRILFIEGYIDTLKKLKEIETKRRNLNKNRVNDMMANVAKTKIVIKY